MSILGLQDARNQVDRATLHQLLDELLDLRELSDPKSPIAPASLRFRDVTGKDAVAQAAVFFGNYLLLASVGWAVNHTIGRALPDADTRSVDSHDQEAAGMAEASVSSTIRDSS